MIARLVLLVLIVQSNVLGLSQSPELSPLRKLLTRSSLGLLAANVDGGSGT